MTRAIGKSPALAAPYGKPLPPIDTLNARRKADREALARHLCDIANLHGATIERRDSVAVRGFGGASIHLGFMLNGVGVMVSLSDLHGGDRGMASWFNDYTQHRGTRLFTVAFGCAVGDGATIRGRGLHHKAASTGANWMALALALDAGLSLAARGEAFEPPSAT